MNNSDNYYRFFEDFARLFDARYRKPLWEKYPSPENDDWGAVAFFLNNYAFERQGVSPDYRYVANDVVISLCKRELLLSDPATAKEAWASFQKKLSGSPNAVINPLCIKGTEYIRKNKSNTTKNKSLFEFLSILEKPNIVCFAKEKLKKGLVEDAYDDIIKINGIGPKITSLFLRDIASHYDDIKDIPIKKRYLLQPVDVWIKRIFQILISPQKEVESKDMDKIVKKAISLDVNPEAVNKGMWYFGSQIAKSNYRLSRALVDIEYAKDLLEEYFEDYISVVKEEEEAVNELRDKIKKNKLWT